MNPEPFISCSRSDRTTRRNSVGLWVHFKILSTLGTRHIVTYQLHSNKSESMLDRVAAMTNSFILISPIGFQLIISVIKNIGVKISKQNLSIFCFLL
ncbi:hypothetical protein AGMMS49587_19430 [Spirochaetia bacterium]|nr:hypothetical protein AGMMS49587_19430 [Spirochaetia bacterium]